MTSVKQQACEWANKVARRYNAGRYDQFGKPVLSIFEFNDNNIKFRTLELTEPDEKWAVFVINNRNRDFSNHGDVLSNHDNKYDIVHGLVANDDISVVLDTFLLGILPISELPKALVYKQLNDQYSFHTQQALSCLKFLRSETI